ncbi:hypothetical protein KTU01_04990 [Kocuria turfanensis]|uniref:Uncharacterized protein n=1 Tax=Kocuria turfanensis TaxID=388357 RepID=A0A512I9J7_9MICC|nr:hypothetical protein KTU01_04990 [Kocuria turfanensis]
MSRSSRCSSAVRGGRADPGTGPGEPYGSRVMAVPPGAREVLTAEPTAPGPDGHGSTRAVTPDTPARARGVGWTGRHRRRDRSSVVRDSAPTDEPGAAET